MNFIVVPDEVRMRGGIVVVPDMHVVNTFFHVLLFWC